MSDRTCDGCTACCKTMLVAEMDSPAGEWCCQCDVGFGCKVHTLRPDVCRGFECSWLSDKNGTVFTEETRPDLLKAIFSAKEIHGPNDAKDGMMVRVFELVPDASKKAKVKHLMALVTGFGHPVNVITFFGDETDIVFAICFPIIRNTCQTLNHIQCAINWFDIGFPSAGTVSCPGVSNGIC